ncbi:ATP-dependent DNA helicase RecG [Candidatus Saccharibacteria bacterium]|nr:ATP-dependent DNA helicase RecG [Candidatus Saccharibacteria bacterium]
MELLDSVEVLKGVGPKRAEILKKCGINTVRDFFYNLPRDYENFRAPTSISAIRPGKVVIKGKISSLTSRRARRRNLSITEGVVSDQTGSIKVIWFNQKYRLKQFTPEKEYYFSGNYEFKNGRYSLISPSAAESTEIDPRTGLNPIYVAHGKLKSNDFRHLMMLSRDKFALIPDLLPSVPSGKRKNALFNAHFPDSSKSIEVAREYLAYEELFELILAARLNRRENDKLKAESIPFEKEKIRKFVADLPFKLTNAQRLATWEIFKNMMNTTPMNRLLQGDVGSGKTMVAALAALEVSLAGKQTALLAPTAILANQHFVSLKKVLEPFGVKVALLTGATKHKPELKKQIADGKIDLVIGTHALLTDDTTFSQLAFVVIDEQHRFGVLQRQKLMLKSPDGLAPHLLAMTATPIPRSLQLTVFGDLDVSILDELPKGRQEITTRILKETDAREQLYPIIRQTLESKPEPSCKTAHGQQIYWVCKAIDENSSGGSINSDATSVKTRTRKLREVFPDYKIEFLHGKMKPTEKDAIMERFSEGEIDILVSTTVIEVGVDVPNATLIIIENAEAYGLAQLHQLRGRVGRSSLKSACFLLTSGDTFPSKRLRELEKSNDGFYLAEVDLKLRGPGEIYGALQHGALDLRIASLSDTKLIHQAQKDVKEFLKEPNNMIKYKELMGGITKYQQITTLN